MSWTLRGASGLIVCILLTLLYSCGSENAVDGTSDPFQQIPFPARETLWTAQKVVDGYPPYERSEGTSQIFDSLVAQAPPNEIEWAIYRLNAGDPAPEMQSIDITFEDTGLGGATIEAWIALADFNLGKWVFQGPYAEAPPSLTLTADNVSPLGNVYLAAVAWNEGAIGIEQISLGFDVPGEQPYAELKPDVPETLKQFGIGLEASGSAAAPGHTLTDYEWDLDGDDIFNETGDEADAQGSASTIILGNNIPGERFVQVRVTDDAALQATATATVRFLGSLIVPVDSGFEESVGEYTSLAVIDGKPAISYYDIGAGNLKFAFSSTTSGNDPADWASITVDDDAADVGQFTSLALIDGKPAIAYYNVTNSDLRYAYSSTASGSSPEDWTITTLHESDDDVGRFASLELVDGKPAIAYRNTTAEELLYVYSHTADGSGTWTTVEVDVSERAGAYPSLAVVNGKPGIAYALQGNIENFPELRYAWSSETNGSSGWSSVLIEGETFTGSFASLAEVDGRPAIAYSNTSGLAALNYAISSTAVDILTEDWVIVEVDTDAVPFHNSLVVVDGKPVIAYSLNQLESVRYAYSTTLDGLGENAWVHFTVDETFNFQGNHTSLAVVDGEPAIAYFAYDINDLNFARPNPDLQPSI